MDYPYKIPLHKTRLYIMATVCTVLCLVCLPVILSGGDDFVGVLKPMMLLAMWVNAFLFGASAWQLFSKARQAGEGMLIDTVGIHDHIAQKSRLISWEDIAGLRSVKVSGGSFILVDVDDPESYIAKAGGLLQRKGLQTNLKRYGTPIAIPTNNLKLGHDEIFVLLEQELRQYRALPPDLRKELKDPLPLILRDTNLS